MVLTWIWLRKYVNNDASVKGIWCVPKYSNPQGVVYSDETVERFAKLKPAADDFRIFWDNAYTVHHLYDDKQAEIPNILELCEKEGNPDMVFEFCSTSKVTFPGAGLAGICTSEKNREDIKKRLTIQTIGHDKINQLRHARFFKDVDGIKAHMAKHAALIRPKFELVENILTDEIASKEASEHGLSRLVDTSSDLRLFQAVQRKSLQSARKLVSQ